MLFQYQKQVQRFIRDGSSALVNPEDIRDYCNQSRREIAMRAQAIPILTIISGSINGAEIISGGSNYTNPSVIISPPDLPSGALPYPNGAQATGLAVKELE